MANSHKPPPPKDPVPDLATLQSMEAQGGQLSISVKVKRGEGLYEDVHTYEGRPAADVRGIADHLRGKVAGGTYQFTVWAPANANVLPKTWEVMLAGAAMAPGAQPAMPMPTAYPMGYPQQPWPMPTAAAPVGPWAPPWPGSSPYGGAYGPPAYPFPPMPAYGAPAPAPQGGPTASEIALQRRLDEEAFSRRLSETNANNQRQLDEIVRQGKDREEALRSELRSSHERSVRDAEQAKVLEGLGAIKEAIQQGATRKGDDPMVSVLTATLTSIGESTRAAVAQATESARLAIEASKTQGRDPLAEMVIKQMLDRGSPQAVGEMAATAGEVMSSAMNMMAQVARITGQGGDRDEKVSDIVQTALDKVMVAGQAIVASVTGQGQGQEGDPEGEPQRRALPEGNGVRQIEAPRASPLAAHAARGDARAAPERPAPARPPTTQTAHAAPTAPVAHPAVEVTHYAGEFRKAVSSPDVPPEAAALSWASQCWQWHVWNHPGGLAWIRSYLADPDAAMASLLPDAPAERRAAIATAFRAMALERVGFTDAILAAIANRDREAAAKATAESVRVVPPQETIQSDNPGGDGPPQPENSA